MRLGLLSYYKKIDKTRVCMVCIAELETLETKNKEKELKQLQFYFPV